MSLLHPTVWLKHITALTPGLLARWGVRGLILDVDNTLTTHGNPVPSPGILAWLAAMRRAGVRLIILSNNGAPRVAPFARLLELPFEAGGKKPLRGGFLRAAKALGLPARAVAVVGDQLFTDVLGGNRANMKTVLVTPIQPEKMWYFRIKRRLEKRVLRKLKMER